jgi:hypothetical protein
MGESFREWLGINRLDLTGICGPHTRAESAEEDFKAVCKRLSTILSTGFGEFFLGDEAIGQAFGWTFMNGKLSEVSIEYEMYDLSE